MHRQSIPAAQENATEHNIFWRDYALTETKKTVQRLPPQISRSVMQLRVRIHFPKNLIADAIDNTLSISAEGPIVRSLEKVCPSVALSAERASGRGRSFVEGGLIHAGTGLAIGLGGLSALSLAGVGFGVAAGGVVLPMLIVWAGSLAAGHKYGVAYEAALQTIYPLMLREEYDAAREQLDRELNNRNLLVRIVRHGFLSKMHYSLGHYFNALVEEKIAEYNDGDSQRYSRVIAEYEMACNDACKTDKHIHFMLLLQKIHYIQLTALPGLRHESEGVVGEDKVAFYKNITAAEEILKKDMKILKTECHEALQQLFMHIIQLMEQCSQLLAGRNPQWNELLIGSVNALLRTPCLYIFENIDADYGDFLCVMITFLRASVLDYLCRTGRESYITQLTLDDLIKKDWEDNYTHSELCGFATEKQLMTLLGQITRFRSKYASAALSESIKEVIDNLENFAVGLVVTESQLRSRNPVLQFRHDEDIFHISSLIDADERLVAIRDRHLGRADRLLNDVLRLRGRYNIPMYSHESLIDSILNPEDHGITQALSGTLTLFLQEIDNFDQDVFPLHQTAMTVKDCLQHRMILEDIDSRIGIKFESLQQFYAALTDVTSRKLNDYLENPYTDSRPHLLELIHHIKNLPAVTGEHAQAVIPLVHKRYFVAIFRRIFNIEYDDFESLISGLMDETHDRVTGLLEDVTQRERLFSIAGDIQNTFGEYERIIETTLKKRSLVSDLNCLDPDVHFGRFGDWVDAINHIGSREILHVFQANGERFRFLIGSALTHHLFSPAEKTRLGESMAFIDGWHSLFDDIRGPYSVDFRDINRFFSAVHDENSPEIITCLERGGEGFINRVNDIATGFSLPQLWRDRKMGLIPVLKSRLYFITYLKQPFDAPWATVRQWVEALRNPGDPDIKKIVMRGGNFGLLFDALLHCLRYSQNPGPLHEAIAQAAECWFVKIINEKLNLNFPDYAVCLKAIHGVQPFNESLQAVFRDAGNESILIGCIEGFPVGHPDRALLGKTLPAIKKEFLISEFNQIFGVEYRRLQDCVDLLIYGEDKTLEIYTAKACQVDTWLERLAETRLFAGSLEPGRAALQRLRLLGTLNSRIKAAAEERDGSYEIKFTSLPAFLRDLVVLRNEPGRLVKTAGMGRMLYDLLCTVDDMDMAGLFASASRSVMQGVLVWELNTHFHIEYENLNGCLSDMINCPEFSDKFTDKQQSDTFFEWLRAIPREHVDTDLLGRAVGALALNMYMSRFNNEFETAFSSVNECLQFFCDERREYSPGILQDKIAALTDRLRGIPVVSSDIPRKRDAAILSIRKFALKQELHQEFKIESSATLDDTLYELCRHLQREGNSAFGVSPSGRTLLHWLSDFEKGCAEEEQVRLLAKKLILLRYNRDNSGNTAEIKLKQRDPFAILPLFAANQRRRNEEQIGLIDEFIDRFKNILPCGSFDCEQFMLLEGPPGTGKTTAVTQYLQTHRADDVEVREWMSGAENDMFVNQVEFRIKKFFDEAYAAVEVSGKLQVLFIDEMDTVCPEISGNPDARYHDRRKAVTVFQTEVSRLKGRPIVLIGTTNFPERISSAMLNRAAGNRVVFPLPDMRERLHILSHAFRLRVIDGALLNKMARITAGWSPRQIMDVVSGLAGENCALDEPCLQKIFKKVSRQFEARFHLDHSQVTLKLPEYQIEDVRDPLAGFTGVDRILTQRFRETMLFLQSPSPFEEPVRRHILLYGKPGGGKTHAISQLLQKSNLPYLVVDGPVSAGELAEVFRYAEQYHPALIFIDEVDVLLRITGVAACLQTHMDGIKKSGVLVVAATNFPERLPEAVFDRFNIRINVPPLTSDMRRAFISETIMACLSPNSILNAAGCPMQKNQSVVMPV